MSGSFIKDLFSHRNGYSTTSPVLKKESIGVDEINAIGSCYDQLCQQLNDKRNDYYYGRSVYFLQIDIERELWVHFANRRLSAFEKDGRYYLVFNELLDSYQRCCWYQALDLVEFVCKWIYANITAFPYLDAILNTFELSINSEFDRLDYGYRILNHCIMDIASNEEMKAVEEAISHSKDNVSLHFQSAITHYSARPAPDVRNSIKESISAVEAACRELTGDDTLGQALKHLEEKGVVIHKMLKEAFIKFYVYTNDADSGIRHALMDSEGTYIPSKDEAYYMLVSCSAFVNYLRRKASK